MSLHRFFLESQVLSSETESEFALRLNADDLHHAHVKRLSAGEHIAVIDAEADYFECEVVRVDKHECIVRITEKLSSAPNTYSISLFQGLGKGDKFETVIRHATEVGCSGFYPLVSKRGVVKIAPDKVPSKLKRWASIAKSAAVQSGASRIPEVFEPLSIEEAVVSMHRFDAVLVCWEESDVALSVRSVFDRLKDDLDLIGSDPCSIAIVVGPEGGLGEDEVSKILAANDHAHLVSLGQTILRTETAGIVSVALVAEELRNIYAIGAHALAACDDPAACEGSDHLSSHGIAEF